ncbi:MAG: lamin tail domain-containing protein [Bacteroidia bacterium]
MKNIFTILFLFPFLASAQLTDDFTDGDFTNNPAWVGDIASWQVLGGQLNSNNLTTNTSFYLATPSSLATAAQWEIWVNFKQATSGSNYMDIYLTSDIQDLNGAGNGYFVRIGGTPDEISLYGKIAGVNTKIIDGTDLRSQVNSTDNYFRIKVTRTAANLWTLLDDNAGGTNYFTEGTITDANFTSSAYFGISVTQSTNSFFNKHFFDSISVGNIVIDVTPPAVSSINVTNANEIDVIFNEPLEQISAETISNYTVNSTITPNAASLISANTVHVTFAANFTSGFVNTLSVLNVLDISNNPIITASTGQFTYFAPVTPSKYDVVINEIFPDESPQIGLPAAEYVEIYNRSNKTFDLSGWKFSDTGTPQNLPSFILTPGSYLILCDDGNASLFSSFGNVLGLSSFPSLNNDGDDLKLYDPASNIIDGIVYDLTLYHDPAKQDGGWSIERINPDFTCTNPLDWKAAVNPNGGTPGSVNSVDGDFSDSQAPSLLRAVAIDATHIKVFFDEAMNAATLSDVSTYSIDNNIGSPAAVSAQTDFSAATLTVTTNIVHGIIYTITINNSISDCAGNILSGANSVRFAIPDSVAISDIIINEILFNPLTTNDYDFVELYNRSQKIIDLAALRIASTDPLTDSLIDVKIITSEGYLIFPGDYVALTASPENVKTIYHTTNPSGFLKVETMPSFNDDDDAVVITNSSFIRMDQFNYSPDFQFPLLNDDAGISLERISFNRPTQDSSNWHSAAETVGYATPAYENSQHAETIDDGSEVSLEPEIFSPDNDGNSDVVNIHYHFGESGFTANLRIFDSKGRLIIHLIKNELLGLEGTFTWNGITSENLKAKVGIYAVYLEVFNEKGTVKKFKKPLVLASKFQ